MKRRSRLLPASGGRFDEQASRATSTTDAAFDGASATNSLHEQWPQPQVVQMLVTSSGVLHFQLAFADSFLAAPTAQSSCWPRPWLAVPCTGGNLGSRFSASGLG